MKIISILILFLLSLCHPGNYIQRNIVGHLEYIQATGDGSDSLPYIFRYDVTTKPGVNELEASIFNKSISNFTLAQNTGKSTLDTLIYTFVATGGHGIDSLDEVLLLDVVGDRSFQAVVKNVSDDTITIDRPIDNIFPSATSLGRIVTSNMAVDGSVTPQIFTFRAGTKPINITRTIIQILGDNTTMDDGKFGNLPALTNGLVFRIIDGYQKTLYNFKTNADIKLFCYDVNYSANAPAGNTGLTARITFSGQDKHGMAIRVTDSTAIQWVIQDDLTGLVNMQSTVEGHMEEMQ